MKLFYSLVILFLLHGNINATAEPRTMDLSMLRIHVNAKESGGESKYRQYTNDALQQWSDALDGKLKYQLTNSVLGTDMVIHLAPDWKNRTGWTMHSAGVAYVHDPNTIVRNVYCKSDMPDPDMQTTILHEIGHMLGLGHSPNPEDVMYPRINPQNSGGELTDSDIAAIRHRYGFSDGEPY